MAKFVDMQLGSFLDALASPEPTPGGGTAAAVAGAMGSALLIMVAGLARSRSGTPEEAAALQEARGELRSARNRFAALADTDSDAYNAVMTAYKLPKSNDAEKSARKAAVQHALTAATMTPLETLRTADEAMQVACIVAQHGNRNAASDIGVGVGLLQAAADGAVANVRINAGSLIDDQFKSSTAGEVDEVAERVASAAAAARRALEQ
jgi:formiminotetrahydrofolate cyclodeaminase